MGQKGILNRRGQVSIMVAMMMTTFLLFFAFVVNTGMLVHAKINLQNAADVAAYAGAAVQARQLNHISYLNYEMRRQYKKFLFRYYVLGNFAQDSQPKAPGGMSPRNWSPNGFPGAPNSGLQFQVPAVCVTFNQNDNFCRTDTLPGIALPPKSFDSITIALRGILEQIASIKDRNCKIIGNTNSSILFHWLYNTDPENKDIQPTGNAELDQILSTIRGLVPGLGLIPKETLLKKRIETLQYYVNKKAEKKVNKERADSLAEDGDSAARERTIQAFLSAYHSLGPATFSNESAIEMDELLPEGDSDSANLLKLSFITPEFDTYALKLDVDESRPPPHPCVPRFEVFSVRGKTLPVGVVKQPDALTYYAVRMRAKAQVLFSPFGSLELTAYAAARPFGSRIGPRLEAKDFVRTPGIAPANVLNAAVNVVGSVPNLPVFGPTDGTARGQGWDTDLMTGGLYAFLRSGGTGAPSTQAISSQDLSKALHAAMAPNPYEKGKYNIPNDLGQDRFQKFFTDASNTYAFWAPIRSSDRKVSDDKKEIEEILQNIQLPPSLADLKEKMVKGLGNYLGSLRQPGVRSGDGEESFTFYRIPNPLALPASVGGNDQPLAIPGDGILMNDPMDFKTSWVYQKESSTRELGRMGYSVKLVSFKSIHNREGTTDGANSWSNGFDSDSELESDLNFIKH